MKTLLIFCFILFTRSLSAETSHASAEGGTQQAEGTKGRDSILPISEEKRELQEKELVTRTEAILKEVMEGTLNIPEGQLTRMENLITLRKEKLEKRLSLQKTVGDEDPLNEEFKRTKTLLQLLTQLKQGKSNISTNDSSLDQEPNLIGSNNSTIPNLDSSLIERNFQNDSPIANLMGSQTLMGPTNLPPPISLPAQNETLPLVPSLRPPNTQTNVLDSIANTFTRSKANALSVEQPSPFDSNFFNAREPAPKNEGRIGTSNRPVNETTSEFTSKRPAFINSVAQFFEDPELMNNKQVMPPTVPSKQLELTQNRAEQLEQISFSETKPQIPPNSKTQGLEKYQFSLGYNIPVDVAELARPLPKNERPDTINDAKEVKSDLGKLLSKVERFGELH